MSQITERQVYIKVCYADGQVELILPRCFFFLWTLWINQTLNCPHDVDSLIMPSLKILPIANILHFWYFRLYVLKWKQNKEKDQKPTSQSIHLGFLYWLRLKSVYWLHWYSGSRSLPSHMLFHHTFLVLLSQCKLVTYPLTGGSRGYDVSTLLKGTCILMNWIKLNTIQEYYNA